MLPLNPFKLRFIAAFVLIIIFIALTFLGEYVYNDKNFPEVCANIFNGIAISVIAAAVYYIFTDGISECKKYKIGKWTVNRYVTELKHLGEECKYGSLHIFVQIYDEKYKQWSCEKYSSEFDKTDLHIKYATGTKEEMLNQNKERIIEICEALILNFFPYLSFERFNILQDVLNSYFICNKLYSKVFGMPEEYYFQYDYFNQKEIGKSIYKVHELLSKL